MKKKTAKKKKPTKQKIDVVLESLLNLEQQMKELIKRIERIETTQYFYLKYQYPERSEPHYWPNIPRIPGGGYAGITWNDGCQNKVSK